MTDTLNFKHPCIESLKESINFAPIWEIDDSGEAVYFLNEEEVERINDISIQIHKKEHSRPHFHVFVHGQDYGSYWIETGEPCYPHTLSKDGKKYCKNIKKWYKEEGKESMIKAMLDKWGELNPHLMRD